MRTVVILGSTGSIGTQALDVIARHRDVFTVIGLAAGGNNLELLAEQARQFHVKNIGVADYTTIPRLRDMLPQFGVDNAELFDGTNAAIELAAMGADVVLNGITGSVGLRPSIAALRAGSQLALANKESVVAGGHLLFDAQIRENQINPVDSEHSAIWQSLRAGTSSEVKKLIVTASGGPFRGWTREQMRDVTPAMALNHPTWKMGPVVTINSSTLMNKGLEVIEASRLFNIPSDRIEVTVHPQSVVHSMVEFRDGATIAQASPPDMRLPIALGLSAPVRMDDVAAAVDWTQSHEWTFEPVDMEAFPALRIARQALETSEKHTTVLNAANEEAVKAFIAGRIAYLDISHVVEESIEAMSAPMSRAEQFESVDEMEELEKSSRQCANSLIDKI